jgi:putative serine protease PepD
MSSSRTRLAAVATTAVLFGAGGGAAVTAITTSDAAPGTVTVTGPATSLTSSSPTQGQALSPAEVYRRSEDSIVYIRATTAQGQATGSGFVVSADGNIVTNAHVVDGATSVEVQVGDGERRKARVVGVDASTDLALLDVDASGLRPLALGDSSRVQVGDPSYAIGNPYGLDRTLTTGVISALHREIDSPNGYAISDALQTDAALNPGNSGGPLFDAAGAVIGVNSQIESSSNSNAGVGFAVPSNTVRRVIEQLRTDGRATHAWLGVSTSERQQGDGAVVAAVTAGGPGADAGLRTGDVITAIGEEAVADSGDVAAQVGARKPGDELELTVLRGGQTETVTVELGTRPS